MHQSNSLDTFWGQPLKSPCSAQLITELANSNRTNNSQDQATGRWLQIAELELRSSLMEGIFSPWGICYFDDTIYNTCLNIFRDMRQCCFICWFHLQLYTINSGWWASVSFFCQCYSWKHSVVQKSWSTSHFFTFVPSMEPNFHVTFKLTLSNY